MNEQQRQEILDHSWKIHAVVENSYRRHPSVVGDKDWDEKQRLLLADMALHLLQSALAPGDLPLDKLTNNIHAILTISDQFLPQAQLKAATDKLYPQPQSLKPNKNKL